MSLHCCHQRGVSVLSGCSSQREGCTSGDSVKRDLEMTRWLMAKKVTGREETTFIVLLDGHVKLPSIELRLYESHPLSETLLSAVCHMWRLWTWEVLRADSGVLSPKWPSIHVLPSPASENIRDGTRRSAHWRQRMRREPWQIVFWT